MQMFAIDGFYLCVMAVADAGLSQRGPIAARSHQLVLPQPGCGGMLRRAHLRTATGVTRVVCAMMQWDNFYIESAHF